MSFFINYPDSRTLLFNRKYISVLALVFFKTTSLLFVGVGGSEGGFPYHSKQPYSRIQGAVYDVRMASRIASCMSQDMTTT